MRLTSTLGQLAVLLTLSGCGGQAGSAPTPDAGPQPSPDAGPQPSPDAGRQPSPDAGPPQPDASPAPDASPDAQACGGCNCPGSVASDPVPPATACAIAAGYAQVGFSENTACEAVCAGVDGGAFGGNAICSLAQDYLAAYQAAQPDAGGDAGAICPTWVNGVVVECGVLCLGRRTPGIAEPSRRRDATLGDLFAERAYLEEVSVHAFARLGRELTAHGAPADLRRRARRAERDEVRHAAAMGRLSRRYGGAPGSCPAPGAMPVRSLLEIALENAVEGCVRETYGALVGLIEARQSADPAVRRAMERIAADECRHAELAWDIARWIRSKLAAEERQAVTRAARAAIDQLAREGDAPVVAALDREVWQDAA